MASSDGVKEPHSFLSYSVGFPSAALIPVAKELLRNLMCMRSVRLLSPLPYHKEESALSLLSLYLSAGRVEADNRSNIKVRVQWYYRPEESMGGRRQFHGAKELFLSDHYDVQSAHTIEGKCTVHSFKNYTKLENVGTEDYYCRFEYKAATGAFTPDRVAVYCKCEMPYNPDDLMVQCEGCKDWYHPACVNMTIEQAKMLDHFMCSDCSSDNDIKKPQNTYPSSPLTNGKDRSRQPPTQELAAKDLHGNEW